MKVIFYALLAVVSLTAFATGLSAGTWYIKADGSGDAATIQAGITSASPGDTVLLANGTYTGTGNRDVNFSGKAIIVCSESDIPDSCVIDCGGTESENHRGFLFINEEGNSSVLRGVKIINAYVNYFTYPSYGGGIYCDSSPTITKCVFESNYAQEEGGGMACEDSSPVVTDCSFNSNESFRGGGLSLYGVTSFSVAGCTFTDNFANNDQGGAMQIYNTTSGTVNNCGFYSNEAEKGGAVFCHNTSFTMSSCYFYGNTGESGRPFVHGAAIYCSSSSPVVEDCTFNHNGGMVEVNGAVLNGFQSSPTFTNCTIYNSYHTGDYCLDIYLFNSDAVFENTIIAFGGGEIVQLEEYEGDCSITFSCCDIYGNAGGDWTGDIAGQYGVNGNISEDPLFCDAPSADFGLMSGSPCNSVGCGIMGAHPVSCLGYSPWILSVSDVGNDQGGQVRLEWARSIYDASGDTVDVSGYGIYRRQDAYMSQVATESGISDGGRDILRSPMLSGWDYIASVPARGDSIYQYVAPTLCDSTVAGGVCWSAYFVSAMTPDPLEYWDSAPDSGYSIDNLAPGVPEGLSVAYNTGSGNQLAWDSSIEPDFQYYRIYRSADPDFVPVPGDLADSIADTVWTDTENDGCGVYYKVTALDFAGNESGAASPGTITGDDVPAAPNTFALHQNIPNPFNPSTTFRFDLPRTCHVKLCVYNVKGELVTAVIDRPMAPGRKEIAWTAKDSRGRAVASGIYFYRLKAGEFEQTRKMVLLR